MEDINIYNQINSQEIEDIEMDNEDSNNQNKESAEIDNEDSSDLNKEVEENKPKD